jgi:hypothetical protein
MDRIGRGLFALALLLACVVPAFATERDAFDKLIKKYAVDIKNFPVPFKAKVACACTDSLPARVGFVLWDSTFDRLYCGLPSFDSSGRFLGSSACQQFEVLAR